MSLASLKTYLMILIVAFAANHCRMVDALTPSAQDKHSSTGHCGEKSHHEDADSSTKGHHSSCSDSGCCQPLLKAFDTQSVTPDVSNVMLNWITVANYIFENGGKNLFIKRELPFATAPPGLSTEFISSLNSAPNAPPILS